MPDDDSYAKAMESMIAVRVALMRLKDETLPPDDRRHFLEELVRHGRGIVEVGQGGLQQLLHSNGEVCRLES